MTEIVLSLLIINNNINFSYLLILNNYLSTIK
jgi:hypothetical protein